MLVPVLFICLYYYYHSAFISTAVILVITLELAVGGLGNLLASRKIEIPFGLSATKSVLQAAFGARGAHCRDSRSLGNSGHCSCRRCLGCHRRVEHLPVCAIPRGLSLGSLNSREFTIPTADTRIARRVVFCADLQAGCCIESRI